LRVSEASVRATTLVRGVQLAGAHVESVLMKARPLGLKQMLTVPGVAAPTR
jgi:hypothetical protein